jgi:hypothetical protein
MKKLTTFQKIYVTFVIIWFPGIFIFTPFLTARYTRDVCKRYSAETMDVDNAATAGLVLGVFWPITYTFEFVDWYKKKQ